MIGLGEQMAGRRGWAERFEHLDRLARSGSRNRPTNAAAGSGRAGGLADHVIGRGSRTCSARVLGGEHLDRGSRRDGPRRCSGIGTMSVARHHQRFAGLPRGGALPSASMSVNFLPGLCARMAARGNLRLGPSPQPPDEIAAATRPSTTADIEPATARAEARTDHADGGWLRHSDASSERSAPSLAACTCLEADQVAALPHLLRLLSPQPGHVESARSRKPSFFEHGAGLEPRCWSSNCCRSRA